MKQKQNINIPDTLHSGPEAAKLNKVLKDLSKKK